MGTLIDFITSGSLAAGFLAAVGLILATLLIRMFVDRISVMRLCVYALTLFLFGYILSTVPLFLADRFLVWAALAVEDAVLCIAAGARLIRNHARRVSTGLAEIDWDLKKQGMPILLAVLAMAISWGNFGFFGMGQDQGVYQTKTIDLMYGRNSRIIHFQETDDLDEAEEAVYLEGTVTKLVGLDNIGRTYDEVSAFAKMLDADAELEYDSTDGIYHGIPTFPALLALYGTIFGLSFMTGIQTVLHVLIVLLLWFTSENLGLKKWTAVLVSAGFLFSPEAVWNADGVRSVACHGILLLSADQSGEGESQMVVRVDGDHVCGDACVHLCDGAYVCCPVSHALSLEREEAVCPGSGDFFAEFCGGLYLHGAGGAPLLHQKHADAVDRAAECA